MEIHIEAADATVAGTVYCGSASLGSLFSGDVRLQDLVSLSDTVYDLKKDRVIVSKNSVVNRQLVYDSSTSLNFGNKVRGEEVTWHLFHAPAYKIDGNNNLANWSPIIHVDTHFLVWPDSSAPIISKTL